MSLRLLIAVLCLSCPAPLAGAADIQPGFERVSGPDGAEIGIWYPSTGMPSRQAFGLSEQAVVLAGPLTPGRYPLVVISHGTGGHMGSHADTAIALARAGFVVAAPTHPGDNWQDTSRATQVEHRVRALGGVISHMLTAWPGRAMIDADRIGAFGFSAGGFAVLAAAGGRPDLSRIDDHCAQHGAEFVCGLIGSQPRPFDATWPVPADTRIRAIVVAAPALGFAFDRAGLAEVRIPVQLWQADDDRILPPAHHAAAVRAALPQAPQFHAVAGAGHFDFLAPCRDPALAPDLCASAEGFDRDGFHSRFNRDVVDFFRASLGDVP